MALAVAAGHQMRATEEEVVHWMTVMVGEEAEGVLLK